MMDVLSNRYRRRVLVSLLNHNPQDDDDLHLPADVELEADELKALREQMWHAHLPKLAATDFIEWNQEDSTVRKGPRFDEIRPLLELMQNHADELPDDWL